MGCQNIDVKMHRSIKSLWTRIRAPDSHPIYPQRFLIHGWWITWPKQDLLRRAFLATARGPVERPKKKSSIFLSPKISPPFFLSQGKQKTSPSRAWIAQAAIFGRDGEIRNKMAWEICLTMGTENTSLAPLDCSIHVHHKSLWRPSSKSHWLNFKLRTLCTVTIEAELGALKSELTSPICS